MKPFFAKFIFSPALLLSLQLGAAATAKNQGALPAAYVATEAPFTRVADTKGFKDVNVEEFEKMRADKKNVVLDVRTPKEFAAGHIPGAINIDVNGPDFDQKVAKLKKSDVYLVHCAAGVRSAKACDKLSKLDFPSLFNLEGGFRAWEKAGNKAEH